MERKQFVTVLKGDHKLNKEYVRGRISGIAYIICKPKHPGMKVNGLWVYNKYGFWTFIHEFTPKQYAEFIKTIEELYPGLCIADESIQACKSTKRGA